jgi:hypothetical protein
VSRLWGHKQRQKIFFFSKQTMAEIICSLKLENKTCSYKNEGFNLAN